MVSKVHDKDSEINIFDWAARALSSLKLMALNSPIDLCSFKQSIAVFFHKRSLTPLLTNNSFRLSQHCLAQTTNRLSQSFSQNFSFWSYIWRFVMCAWLIWTTKYKDHYTYLVLNNLTYPLHYKYKGWWCTNIVQCMMILTQKVACHGGALN